MFYFQKKPPQPVEHEPLEFQAPSIFKTSDYFKPPPKEKSLDSEGITMKLEVDLEKKQEA